MIFLLFFEQEYHAAVQPFVASTSRPLAQAGSVFCENFLAAFAFSPWLRLGYSALLRVLVALPVSCGPPAAPSFDGRASSLFPPTCGRVTVRPPVAFWGYWGPVGDPLKKPGCPSLCEVGKRGFAPTELLSDQSPCGLQLVGQNSPAPPPGPRPGPGASAPTFAAPRRPLRFA